jgi:hypothetical protein
MGRTTYRHARTNAALHIPYSSYRGNSTLRNREKSKHGYYMVSFERSSNLTVSEVYVFLGSLTQS